MKKGNQGTEVKVLQIQLNKILGTKLVADGYYGTKTENAVKDFQAMYNLVQNGICEGLTSELIFTIYNKKIDENNLLTFGADRFVVFVDSGHGGINDKGEYVTPGKRAYHHGHELHQNGNYYEGYENRLAAERFIELCTDNGIQTIRTYHPYKDTSLSERTELVRAYLKRGYFGYLHSFHSNAISHTNSKEKLEATRGFMVFNTRGDNFSDQIATQHFKNVAENVENITLRPNNIDGDVDHEANFQMLRETDLNDFSNFGAILDEWDFHTSAEGCENIIRSREQRAKACLLTAQWVKNELTK